MFLLFTYFSIQSTFFWDIKIKWATFLFFQRIWAIHNWLHLEIHFGSPDHFLRSLSFLSRFQKCLLIECLDTPVSSQQPSFSYPCSVTHLCFYPIAFLLILRPNFLMLKTASGSKDQSVLLELFMFLSMALMRIWYLQVIQIEELKVLLYLEDGADLNVSEFATSSR